MAIPVKFGTEILVNLGADTANNQDDSTLVALDTGLFVAAWANDFESQRQIIGRKFHADGTNDGGARDLTFESALQPKLAKLDDGGLVLVFQNPNPGFNGDGSGSHIVRQQFDGGLNLDGGAPDANTTTAGNQVTPVVAGLDNGRYVAVWGHEGGATRDLRARVFNNDGSQAIAEFFVQTNSAGGQVTPSVTALPGGRFVVTWTDGSGTLGDSSVNSVKAKIFDADGGGITVVKDEFLVNSTTANAQTEAVVAATAGGNFAVVWTHDVAAGAGGNSDVRARIFNSAGTAQGNDILLGGGDQIQSAPAIAALKDGRFVAAYVDNGAADGSGSHIRVIVFGTAGVGAAIVANTTTGGNQTDPSVTGLADGRFVVGWTDASQTGGDTSGNAVRAQIFDPREAGVEIDGTTGADEYIGSAFSDTLRGGGGNDILIGGAAGDTLQGGNGADTLDGGAGADILEGGADGDVYVLGTDATDTVTDTGGLDAITSTISRSLAGHATIENLQLLGTANINATGNALVNALLGNSGDNSLSGGAGIDSLDGGAGNDTYVLEADADIVTDSSGSNDTISSTIARSLESFATIERLVLAGTADINGTGNGLNNFLFGNTGRNTLNGGGGNDTLIGGTGRDIYTGGANSDTFDWNAVNETGNDANTRDAITDFTTGADKIDLASIDANGALAGDPNFVFIGQAAFTSGGGRLRFFQVDNPTGTDITVVEGDIDGNAVADFQIQLTGLINLAVGDFNP